MRTLIIFAVIGISLIASSPSYASGNTGEFCRDCRSTMSYLAKFNSSSQQDPYTEALKNFCAINYPSSMDYRDGPCGIIVSAIQYLVRHTDPVHHCDEVAACSTVNMDKTTKKHPGLVLFAHQDTGVFCDVCKSGFESIKAQLEDPAMLKQLRLTLESFCEYLKVIDESEDCKVHIPEIINYITNLAKKIDPQSYCESVKVCNPQRQVQVFKAVFDGFGIFMNGQVLPENSLFGDEDNKQEAAQQDPESDKYHKKGPTCLMCKFIITELNHLLKNNRTQENIENTLDDVCERVFVNNDEKKDKCKDFVTKYSKKMIEILSEEMNPELVCILLEQCVYAKEEKLEPFVQLEPQPVKTGTIEDLFVNLDSSLTHGSFEVCVECKLFIKYLQQIMKNTKNEQEMKDILKKDLCDKLARDNQRDECYALIDKYAIEFFDAVTKSINPHETCAKLGACKNADPDFNVFATITKLFKETQNFMVDSMAAEKKVHDTTAKKVPQPKETVSPVLGVVCDDCVKIVKSIDDYISKEDVDHDVDKIIDNVCKKMEPNIANKCSYVVELFGTQIIQVISSMKDPIQVCQSIFMC